MNVNLMQLPLLNSRMLLKNLNGRLACEVPDNEKYINIQNREIVC